eukprot:359555-Chlamydomonas_euryale.AAC.4
MLVQLHPAQRPSSNILVSLERPTNGESCARDGKHALPSEAGWCDRGLKHASRAVSPVALAAAAWFGRQLP